MKLYGYMFTLENTKKYFFKDQKSNPATQK